MTEVKFTHEKPPIPTRDHDWRAGFDGREEEGRDGWGPTKLAAAIDLYRQCETIEDTIDALVGVLRADMEQTLTDRPSSGDGIWRQGYEAAIRTIEGMME